MSGLLNLQFSSKQFARGGSLLCRAAEKSNLLRRHPALQPGISTELTMQSLQRGERL